jgi:phage antirepressor YoqD-like protein
MKRYKEQLYYNVRESAMLLEISTQTLFDYIRISKIMISEDEQPIIPQVTRINNVMHFSERDIEYIKKEMLKFKNGMFTKYRRTNNYQVLKEENKRLKEELAKYKP